MTTVLDPSQEAAVTLECTARLGIVTGGPGTGKTTCLRAALDRLDARNERYLLAAPTGKAARRVQETTGRPAGTIHRLLEYDPRVGGFTRNERNRLDAGAVFIDESSMMDTELAASLAAAIDPKRTRLILIGDADQLPPVGPGRPFGDLVDSGLVPVARLTTLHRSAQDSWIHVNAQRVLRGAPIDLAQRPDFRFVQVAQGTDIVPALLRIVTHVIPKEIGLGKSADVFTNQVLIPQKTGVAGVKIANIQLQAALNPRVGDDPYMPRGDTELRLSDRVIQTKNDYKLVDSTGALGIFNGETGEIEAIDKDSVVVNFPERGAVRYSHEQAKYLQHSYALTVHRYQGSETPWAVVVCHSTHTFSLSRQLLYTAITRGKRGVILVGDEKGIGVALSSNKPPERNTTLIARIKGELEPAAVL